MTKTQIPNILFFFPFQIICSPSGNAMMVGTTTSPTPTGGQPVSSTLKAVSKLTLFYKAVQHQYVIQLLDLRFALFQAWEKRRQQS